MRRIVSTLALFAAFWLLVTEAALADNCSGLTDCFNTLRAAIAAAVGLGIFGAVVSFGLDLLPGVGTVKGAIEAFTGRDLVTGERLAWWERLLGVVPLGGALVGGGAALARGIRRAGDVADAVGDVGRGVRRAGEVADTMGDLGRGARRAGDVADATGEAGRFERGFSGARYIDEANPRAARMYDEIVGATDDVPNIARNTGVSEDVINNGRRHVFLTEHEVAVGPGVTRTGRFTPDEEIADLWNKARRGDLAPDELERFRRLMAHEYVESELMKRGMPYRSADPSAWERGPKGDYANFPTPQHHGAHDLAPHTDAARPPFDHWRSLGRTPGDWTLAPDLSNLDDIVSSIVGGG